VKGQSRINNPETLVSGLFMLDCPFTILREFLDCLFLIPLHNFSGVSGLFILDCPFTMLREFLDCLFLIPLHNFAGVSGLFILDCPFTMLREFQGQSRINNPDTPAKL
jgi:hypothetical protein